MLAMISCCSARTEYLLVLIMIFFHLSTSRVRPFRRKILIMTQSHYIILTQFRTEMKAELLKRRGIIKATTCKARIGGIMIMITSTQEPYTDYTEGAKTDPASQSRLTSSHLAPPAWSPHPTRIIIWRGGPTCK